MTLGSGGTAYHSVGPVLIDGDLARAVVEAIRQTNDGVEVLDRGSYLRVLVPWRCVLTVEGVEQAAGRPFHLPGDLEKIMPSFKGRLRVGRDRVEWAFHKPGDPAGENA